MTETTETEGMKLSWRAAAGLRHAVNKAIGDCEADIERLAGLLKKPDQEHAKDYWQDQLIEAKHATAELRLIERWLSERKWEAA